jgi:serine/threonine protein kinase
MNSEIYFFKYEIRDWKTWGDVFQSISIFKPLIKSIFEIEKIPFGKIENTKPGTHGVFKVGKYIVKIFAPKASGYDSTSEYKTEINAMDIARKLDILVPKMIAKGSIDDKYGFNYLIMEYIDGKTIGDIKSSLSSDQKYNIGKKIKWIVDRFSKSSEHINEIEVINRTLTSDKWMDCPKDIKDMQTLFLNQIKDEKRVFVHGDLTEDNIIITPNFDIYILDFADAVSAPEIYEYMPLIADAFSFDKDFIRGFFGDINIHELVTLCLHGILIHEYGFQSIKQLFTDVIDVKTLKEQIYFAMGKV